MKIDPDLIKLLMQMGYMAINMNRLNEAKTIFRGLAKARPDISYPKIGLGCTAIANGDFASAIEILNGATTMESTETERDLCRSILGIALKLEGRHDESQEVLNQLRTEGAHETAIGIADKFMEESGLGDVNGESDRMSLEIGY